MRRETAKKTVALLGDEEEEPPAKKKGQSKVYGECKCFI